MKILTLDGRLGKDAEIKVSPNKREFIFFSLANDSYIKGENKTIWYEVSIFNVDAFRARLPYFKKGTYVCITGIPDESAYVAKDGSLRIQHSLLASSVEFLKTGGKSENGSQISESNQNTYSAPTNEPSVGVYVPPINVSAPQPNVSPSVEYPNSVNTKTVPPAYYSQQTNITDSAVGADAGSPEANGDDLPF